MKNNIGLLIGSLILLSALPLATVAGAGEAEGIEMNGIVFERDIPNGLAGFIENRGQWDPSILFAARSDFGKAAFQENGIIYDVSTFDTATGKVLGYAMEMEMVGARTENVEGMEPTGTEHNFFSGSDPDKWGIGAGSYGYIRYTEAWEGLDIKYYFRENSLKYDIISSPHSDISKAVFRVPEEVTIHLDDNGLHLEFENGLGLVEAPPIAFYDDAEGGMLGSGFARLDEQSYTIELENRDPTRPVRVDPLVFSTFVGGMGTEYGYGMDADGQDNVYMSGSTNSFNFPVTSGAYQSTYDNQTDGYFCKLDSTGTSMDYATYFGGDKRDRIMDVALDSQGNIWIAGDTNSPDIPTTANAYNTTLNGNAFDIMAAKFDPTGSNLIYSTYIGGTDDDRIQGRDSIAVNPEGYLVVVGNSFSSDYPTTPDAIDSDFSGMMIRTKGILTMIDGSSSDLKYSTYYGGTMMNMITSVALNEEGEIFMTGATQSMDFPTTEGAYMTEMTGLMSGFVVRIDLSLQSPVVYSTLLGGPGFSNFESIAVDDENAYITGATRDAEYPITEGAYQNESNGNNEVFITKMNHNGSALVYSTFVGSEDNDHGHSIKVTEGGEACVVGYTESRYFPHMDQYVYGLAEDYERESFMLKMNSEGDEMAYGALFGGQYSDIAYSLKLASNGDALITGVTGSPNFPVSDDAFEIDHQGSEDSFALRINLTLPPGRPRDLAVEQGDAVIDLSWSEPSNNGGLPITNYTIYRGPLSTNMGEYITVGNQLNYADTDVLVGKNYYYLVKAVNGAGTGPASGIEFTKAVSRPEAPAHFRVYMGNGFNNIHWDRPYVNGAMDIISYNIYRESDEDGIENIATLGEEERDFNDTTVTNGIEYTYWMTAVNAIGESDPSYNISVIPKSVPSIPRNLTVEVIDASVHLQWDEPVNDGGIGISGYEVLKHLPGDAIAVIEVIGTEFVDAEVAIGSSYTYSVRAYNGLGRSKRSEDIEVHIKTLPGAPIDLRAQGGNGLCTLRWSENSMTGGLDLIGYHVYRSEEGGPTRSIEEMGSSTVFYIDRDVSNGVEYTYVVRAVNDLGESQDSNNATAVPAGPPSEPLQVTAIEVEGSIVVEWNAPSFNGGAPITGYTVIKEGPEGISEIDVSGDAREYVDENVTAGETYAYMVKAYNRMDTSLESAIAYVDMKGAPSAPIDLTATQVESGVGLSWDIPAELGGLELTYYKVYRSVNSSDWEEAATLEPSETNYLDTSIELGTNYAYAVKALNSRGASPLSEVVEIIPTGVPEKPTNVKAYVEDAIEISWKEPSSNGGESIIHYVLERSVGDRGFERIGTVLSSERIFVDYSAEPGVEYTYRVVAVNIRGESSPSDPVTASLDKEAEESSGISNGVFFGTVGVLLLIMILLAAALLMARRSGKEPRPMPAAEPQEATSGPMAYGGYAGEQEAYEQEYSEDSYYE
ncbi:MAG: fibronectin type III domain-containing protein [Thermoplasmatota archaeon]